MRTIMFTAYPVIAIKKKKIANISLTLYTNGFFGSILRSPIEMGSLSVNNSVTNISRLGTFKQVMERAPCLVGGSGEGWGEGSRWVRAGGPGRLSSPRPPSVEAAGPRSRWWWEASPTTKDGVNNKNFTDPGIWPWTRSVFGIMCNTLSSKFLFLQYFFSRQEATNQNVGESHTNRQLCQVFNWENCTVYQTSREIEQFFRRNQIIQEYRTALTKSERNIQ